MDWILAFGAIILIVVMYEQAPSVGGPLLILVVLGMLVYASSKGRL